MFVASKDPVSRRVVLATDDRLYTATVPLTGFGNLLAKGVRDAVAEKGVLGAFTGGFEAGAAGICAAIFFGLLVAMCFKSKDKQ